ncbi:hypothetical protein HK098_004422 [Nowakowskiella sp. JEL0407]|nr:hypothetical protein HK098_004422 [Nowakowskiella sp. JEL0407]
MPDVVDILQDEEKWNEAINKKKLVIVDFYAEWCGPCKQMEPEFKKLAETHTSDKVSFLKVDLDEAPEVADMAGVVAMPFFIAYKDGQKVDEVRGARKDKLAEMVEKNLEGL